MIREKNQDWQVGSKVTCGFMRDLEVTEIKATPGDYLPDAYLLEKNGKFYEFVPHNGIKRIELSDVCRDWMRS